MKTLYCNECQCLVAEITSGSRIMVGSTVYCASCSGCDDQKEETYDSCVVDNLMNLLRKRPK